MEDLEYRPVGKIVADDYRAATILKGYKIDFCCQGGISLAEACKKKNVSIWEITRQLNELGNQQAGEVDYRTWPIDLICDYIEKKHHRYVRQRIEEIPAFLDKVARVHGSKHPELLEIRELFSMACNNLLSHMEKEEKLLFPAIKDLTKPALTPTLGFNDAIDMLREEHQQEGERFAKIAELSNDYQPPEEACNTFRVSYALLKEFEEDLHKHIHLENNVLFEKLLTSVRLIV